MEPLAPVVLSKGKTRSEQSRPNGFPDFNEAREEQRVLNNNALLKQYLYNDSLNNVVLNENKETASYHVVSGAEESANWQKGAESLIQLGKDKVNTNQTSTNNAVSPYPVGEEDEDDRKDAARFQSQVIQDDDMLTKDEVDDHATVPSEANDSEELGEGDEGEQAANIQSLMKQEDEMIQNQEAEEDEESSGSNNMAEGALSRTSNGPSTGNDVTKNSSQIQFSNSNQSLASITSTGKQPQEKSNSFYATGIALSNNPNDTREFVAMNGTSEDIPSSSFPGNGMISQSSLKIHQGIDEQKEDKPSGVMEQSTNSPSQNVQTANVSASITPNHDKMTNQAIPTQQLDLTGAAVAPDLNNASANDRTKGENLNSSPTALISQGETKRPSPQEIDHTPVMSHSLTLTDMIVPGASITPAVKNPHVSQLEGANVPPQQYGSQLLNQSPINATSGSLKHKDSALVSNNLSPNGQANGTNAAIESPIGNNITASDSVTAGVHHVSSPALITLPSASSRPIKLIFHISDMKSKGISSSAPVAGSEAAAGYQSTTVSADDMANKMKDEGN